MVFGRFCNTCAAQKYRRIAQKGRGELDTHTHARTYTGRYTDWVGIGAHEMQLELESFASQQANKSVNRNRQTNQRNKNKAKPNKTKKNNTGRQTASGGSCQKADDGRL